MIGETIKDTIPSLLVFLILVINQLNAQSLFFYNKFIICFYMFRELCVHHQEVTIVLKIVKIVLKSSLLCLPYI